MTVKHWFDAVKQRVVDAGVPPDHQFAIDETGFLIDHGPKTQVMGRHRAHNTHKRGGGSRESITSIVTIRGDGGQLIPTIIFKGVKLLKHWGRVNPLAAK
jgi:hypothetical protein